MVWLWLRWLRLIGRSGPPGAVMEMGRDQDGVYGFARPDDDLDGWVNFRGSTAGDVLDQAVARWPDHCFEVLVSANCAPGRAAATVERTGRL